MRCYQISYSALMVDKSLVTLVSAVLLLMAVCMSARMCVCLCVRRIWRIYIRNLPSACPSEWVNFHFPFLHPSKARRKFAQLSETQILAICLLGSKKWNCSREHFGFVEGNWFLLVKCGPNATGPQVQCLRGHWEVHTDETWLHSISTTWTSTSCPFSIHSWSHVGSHMRRIWLWKLL